tara:strand:- start:324 stop:1496 length:1173 start_codon:yes stop_codon:yes gene_type:complete
MILSYNCAPTLIFIGFSLIQIFIDLYKGVVNDAFIKFIVMIVFSVILNILCDLGYKVIAWFLVFIPIIMMTLISTLLLKVFGTDPDEKDLRNQLKLRGKDLSDNYVDNSDNYLGGANLLNQQKYAYFYDRYNAVERIDRNKHTRKFYDKVEDVYNLNSPVEDLYDLSNNPIKYIIVDRLINILGENYFTHQVSSFLNINYPFKNSNLSHYYNSSTSSKINPNYQVRLDKINSSEFESYEKKYDETYLLDGQFLFRRNKYAETKEKYPNKDDIFINRVIDNEWNNLTATQQRRWNDNAESEKNKDSISYNEYDFSRYRPRTTPIYEILSSKYSNNEPCPINETKQSFKQKTGLDCYEICPPGKEKNSTGLCVRPCPTGKERKKINGNCENI